VNALEEEVSKHLDIKRSKSALNFFSQGLMANKFIKEIQDKI
jgi:hypothetical protein